MKGYFRKRGCKCGGKRCTCDATWSFSIDIGRDPLTGKRIQRQVGGFKTKKEAQAACAAMHTELAEGTYIAEKEMLFPTLVEEWLKLYETTVKISTVRVRKHEASRLLDYFQNHQVKSITRKAYQNALLDLYKRGFALNTIAGIHSTGRMLFSKAIELEVIKIDPTQYAKLPRHQKTVEEIEAEENKVKYLEKHELSKLLQTAREQGLTNDYVIFLTLAYSGLRVGELCALTWNNLSFIEDTLSVTKTYYNPTNRATEYHLLTPKTSTETNHRNRPNCI
jgi:integrase